MLSMNCFASTAYTNMCTPTGGTKQYTFNMGNKVITDPLQNKAGTFFANVYSWANAGSFTVTCSCPGSYTPHYKATSSLPPGHNDGNQYYKVNDNLEVMTKIYLMNTTTEGTVYKPVPFEMVSTALIACSGHTYMSGGDGNISLYITKPFVGQSTFNNIKIASFYISADSKYSSQQASADINMSGVITVPQNCVINSGTALVVDLGSIIDKNFKAKGQLPDGYTPKKFNFGIKCNNLDAQASLSLSITATPATALSTAIASSNSDVGIVIADEQGTPLKINSDNGLSFHLDSDFTTELSLMAWPTSTTGKLPTAGKFDSVAQLNVTYQ